MKAKLLLSAAAFICAAACGNSSQTNCNNSQFIGNWQEIMPEGNNFVKCIVLEDNGSASSIGTISTSYSSWKLENTKEGVQNIVLQGVSTESGQPVNFTDTLTVIDVKDDTLTVQKWGDYQIQYVKRDNINVSLDDPDKLAKAIHVASTTNNDPNIEGYIVFSLDSSSVELFLPEINVTLQKRTGDNGISVWNIEDDDTYLVEKAEGCWQVSRRGTVLYKSAK